jgi:hypothetical protein
VGVGARSEKLRLPFAYCVAWPGSVEPPVGANMRLEVEEDVMPDSGWPVGDVAECSILNETL